MADYKFHHDPARCVSCGLCEAFCPCYVLQMQDERFRVRFRTLEGWTAQIAQHEIDHCNGVLI